LYLLVLSQKLKHVQVWVHILLEQSIEPLAPLSRLEEWEEAVHVVGWNEALPYVVQVLKMLIALQIMFLDHSGPL